jgi:hypothetical protein
VALGQQALTNNTTANSNTAVGYLALYSNTTASQNVAVGYQAGYSTTTGGVNAFIGTFAGFANTTGGYNTALGTYALQANTTASYNTAIGYQAAYYNTTGANNIAIGYGTLAGSSGTTTGNYNTAIGNLALTSITTASYQTAVGYQAGYSNTTGGYNTFVGTAAGYSTTGYGNTFVGPTVGGSYGSGYYVTSGNYNTILGAYNGNQGGLDIRTSSNYIVLSDGAGNPRGIFDNSGTFLVGVTASTASPVQGIVISGSSSSGVYIGHASGTSGGNYYQTFSYNGGVIGSISQSGTTAVLYNVTSDQRLKENIVDADSASSLVDALQVRQFDWKSDRSHQRYGFIAQELVNVAPEAVHQPADPEEMMAVDYSKLVPMLVKEIQSLRKRLANAGIA